MIDFVEGDRVEYIKGSSNLIGHYGTVVQTYTRDGDEFVTVKLDDGYGEYNFFPWRLQCIEDDFMPSEYGLEVLL